MCYQILKLEPTMTFLNINDWFVSGKMLRLYLHLLLYSTLICKISLSLSELYSQKYITCTDKT